jgi:hypothetical protein
MGIEPTSEAWGSFANRFEPTSQNPSGGCQPLEANRQTFGPLPAPGTIHACKGLFSKEVYLSAGFKADPATLLEHAVE